MVEDDLVVGHVYKHNADGDKRCRKLVKKEGDAIWIAICTPSGEEMPDRDHVVGQEFSQNLLLNNYVPVRPIYACRCNPQIELHDECLDCVLIHWP
jgi:hypothetical protein